MPAQNVQQRGHRLEVIDRDLWRVRFPFRGIDFAAAYPDKRVFATPGVGKKQPKARIDEPLGQTPDLSWAGDLDQVALEGMDKMNEVAFFRRPSKSLFDNY